MIQRIAVLGVMVLMIWGGADRAVAKAQSVPDPLSTEILIILPTPRHLAIYQQMLFQRDPQTAVIGVLSHASGIQPVNGGLISVRSHYAIVKTRHRHFALRYQVPWNGQMQNYALPAYLTITHLAMLVPLPLTLPPVLNPALAWQGRGHLAAVAGSPVFSEYVTSHLMAGEDFSIMVARQVAGQGRDGRVLTSHLYPGLGAGIKWAMGVLAGSGIFFAIRRTQMGQIVFVRSRIFRNRIRLQTAFWRGQISAQDFQREKERLRDREELRR